jgi:hypothetical protein
MASGSAVQTKGLGLALVSCRKRQTPAKRAVHLILDNYATHKHPKVRAWLGRPALSFPLNPNLRLLAQRR